MTSALTLKNLLTANLGTDPESLEWPADFRLAAGSRDLPASYDPHNALVTIYGAHSADFATDTWQGLLSAGREAPALCTRVLVFAPDDRADQWEDLGFQTEGVIEGFWPDGMAARLWALAWGPRSGSAAPSTSPDTAAARVCRANLPPGWLCRPAGIPDAAAIGDLLRAVFPDYPIPDDPGAIRYALASGAVHGRVVLSPDERLMAYASAEFQPGGGAAEITDCATATKVRGRGLMSHLVTRLRDDLEDVFDGCGAYSFARVDQPAMAAVLAGCGWRRCGQLVGHFRLGRQWQSADLWQAPPDDQAGV